MPQEIAEEDILSVTDLNRTARIAIEERLHTVWVLGELSNFARPRSGHWYFTLKDENAQVRCAMFANRNRAVQMQPGDGQLVLLRGRVSLYEARGDFQIIADYMEPAGEGALRQAFEKSKQKLAAEGLFDADRKQVLPDFPLHCAIISSPSGAALRDVLAVFRRRYPNLQVTLIPSQVQGAEAEAQLLEALRRALLLAPDVILLTRGGGSLEDLWCFNSEALARQIAAAEIPIVSAVGHEIDTTLCDFVADVRAPTPSAGAELITPDRQELLGEFVSFERQLRAQIERQLQHQNLRLAHQRARLADPQQVIERFMQRTDDALGRVQRLVQQRLSFSALRQRGIAERLRLCAPDIQIEQRQQTLQQLKQRLQSRLDQRLQRDQTRLGHAARSLHNLSPLPTLSRGFALLTGAQGNVVSSVAAIQTGEKITAQLSDGSLHATIDAIDHNTLDQKL